MSVNPNDVPVLRIEILPEVVVALQTFRQSAPDDKEACGLLIGTHGIAGDRLRIEHATLPTRRDHRSRFGFRLRDPAHQHELESLHKSSGNEKVLLGTWHTHPEPRPSPSALDRADWLKQFELNKELLGQMVFCIVGIEETRYWLVSDHSIRKIEVAGIIGGKIG